jgi:hypothetical protein
MGPFDRDLMRELGQREVERDTQAREWQLPPAWRADTPAPDGGGAISPELLHTLGGLADAASTYYFLKRGTGREANPMLNMTSNHPEATALGALAGLGITKGAAHLLRKLSPRLADAAAANLGAEQLALAVSNFTGPHPKGSFGNYGDTMIRAAQHAAVKR